MFPTLSIGPLQVQTKPILILVSLYAFLWLGEREARKRGVNGDHVWNAGFYSLITGAAVGRLAHVLLNWPSYRGNLGQALSLNPGTVMLLPASLTAALVWVIYARSKRISLLVLGDALAPGAALAWAILSLANLAAGDAYGSPTSLPWGIRLWGQRRHPTQVYEMLAALAVFSTLLVLRRKSDTPGTQTLRFMLFAGVAMLFLGAFQAHPWSIAGLRGEQILGLAMAIVGVAAMPSHARGTQKSE